MLKVVYNSLVPKKKIPTKVNLDPETFELLENMAARLRTEIAKGNLPSRGRGKSWGAGTVAADIIEKVVRDQPSILKAWFSEQVVSALMGEDGPNPQYQELFDEFKKISAALDKESVEPSPKARGGRKTKEHVSL